MIHVVAEIQLAPGAIDRYLEEFRRLAPLVRAEDGCIEYGGAIDLKTGVAAAAPRRADRVTVIEKWRDEAALEAHLAAPHMAAYRRRVADLVLRAVIHVMRPVGEPG